MHPHLTTTAADSLREAVVRTELKGWHHLIRVLKREEFKPVSQNHIADLAQIEREMQQSRHFLQAKYQIVKPEMPEPASDAPTMHCPICGFDAIRLEVNESPLLRTFCAVPVADKAGVCPTRRADANSMFFCLGFLPRLAARFVIKKKILLWGFSFIVGHNG